MKHYRSKLIVAGTLAAMLTLPAFAIAEGTLSQEGAGGKAPAGGILGQNGTMMHAMPIRGAVGTSTGKGGPLGGRGGLLMASDTRVLPPGMERTIEERDRMMGSGTPDGRGEPRGRMMGSSTDGERGGMRERMGEHRGDMLQHAADIILKRMHAAIDRFTKMSDRIDARIAKMKAGGADTSGAEAGMVTVRSKIADASSAVADAETAVAGVATSLDQGTTTPPSDQDKKPAKDALEKAKQAILAVAQALKDEMPFIMGGGQEGRDDRGQASTTHATGTPRMPGMMRTKDRPMPTTTSGRPDPTL